MLMKNTIEFRNFTNDNKEVYADFYYDGTYISGVSEHIEFLYQHEYESDDESCCLFRKSALAYLEESSFRLLMDGILQP